MKVINSLKNQRILIQAYFTGVPSSDDSTFFIRLMLVREHEGYTHMPVDKVCQKHQDQEEEELKNHVIRYSKGDFFAFNQT